jgi:hypothetical protein
MTVTELAQLPDEELNNRVAAFLNWPRNKWTGKYELPIDCESWYSPAFTESRMQVYEYLLPQIEERGLWTIFLSFLLPWSLEGKGQGEAVVFALTASPRQLTLAFLATMEHQ